MSGRSWLKREPHATLGSTLKGQAFLNRALVYTFLLSSFLTKLSYYRSYTTQVLILGLLTSKINSYYSVRDSPKFKSFMVPLG